VLSLHDPHVDGSTVRISITRETSGQVTAVITDDRAKITAECERHEVDTNAKVKVVSKVVKTVTVTNTTEVEATEKQVLHQTSFTDPRFLSAGLRSAGVAYPLGDARLAFGGVWHIKGLRPHSLLTTQLTA
jgi:hypothetical protein